MDRLNAILIGRLGFTVEEAIQHYVQITEVAYSNTGIEAQKRLQLVKEVLENVLHEAGLTPTAKMEDSDTRGGECKTCAILLRP